MSQNLDIPTKEDAILETEALIGYIDTREMLIEDIKRRTSQIRRLHIFNLIAGFLTGWIAVDAAKALTGNNTERITIVLACVGIVAFTTGILMMLKNTRKIADAWDDLDKIYDDTCESEKSKK